MKKPHKIPFLTEHENRHRDEGGRLISGRLLQLLSAWKEDFRQVLSVLCEHVKVQSDVNWLGGDDNLTAIQARLGRALELVIYDVQASAECGGNGQSFETGLDCLLELTREAFTHRTSGESLHGIPEEPEAHMALEIQSCLIALIARGEVQGAVDLARSVGACSRIITHWNRSDLLEPGYQKRFGPELDRLRILATLSSQLENGCIPTLKALRISAFSQEKDAGDFNRLLVNMKIKELLPNESTGSGNPPTGTLHQGMFPVDSDLASEFPESASQLKAINNKISEIDDSWQQGLKPSGDTTMIDVEIRRIKESLGPVYHLLLIQFGMDELETTEHLDLFIAHLSGLGLELNPGRRFQDLSARNLADSEFHNESRGVKILRRCSSPQPPNSPMRAVPSLG
jgi:hypothetical protein